MDRRVTGAILFLGFFALMGGLVALDVSAARTMVTPYDKYQVATVKLSPVRQVELKGGGVTSWYTDSGLRDIGLDPKNVQIGNVFFCRIEYKIGRLSDSEISNTRIHRCRNANTLGSPGLSRASFLSHFPTFLFYRCVDAFHTRIGIFVGERLIE